MLILLRKRSRLARLSFLLGSIVLLGTTFIISSHVTAQTAPSLGTAASFAVLAGSAITNTGPSVVNGNLGVSPGSALTGFPPGNVTPPATIHAADAVALQAQSDVNAAFVALGSQSCNANLAAELGGTTLTTGVYCIAAAQLTGQLTLDTQGDPNAVFIFKIESTLITAISSSVIFINGGSCNVWWQVGSSATLGTSSSFSGNILAHTSITLNTGTTVSGRVLALNGAVTMDTNTVGSSACVALPPPSPGLSLTTDDGGVTVAPGDTISYTLNFQNTGNVTLQPVTLTDAIPVDTTFNAGASTPGWNCSINPCTFDVGTLLPGAIGSVVFAVTVNNSATVTEISNGAGIASGATTATAIDSTPLITSTATNVPVPSATAVPTTVPIPGATGVPTTVPIPGTTGVPTTVPIPGATGVPTTIAILDATIIAATRSVLSATIVAAQTFSVQTNASSQIVIGMPDTGGGPPQATYWTGRPSR